MKITLSFVVSNRKYYDHGLDSVQPTTCTSCGFNNMSRRDLNLGRNWKVLRVCGCLEKSNEVSRWLRASLIASSASVLIESQEFLASALWQEQLDAWLKQAYASWREDRSLRIIGPLA